MKRLKAAMAVALLLGFTALPVSAVVFEFSTEFSGSGGACADTVCATLSVEENLTGGVDFLLSANLASGEFIPRLYGNKDPLDDLQVADFLNFAGTGQDAFVSVRVGLNAFKADGDGYFDWLINFRRSPPRFDNGDTFSWTIVDTSLADVIDAVSQGGPTSKTGYTFALKVQGLGAGNEDSGWFLATPREQQVSEPGVLALVGMALLALGFVRRRGVLV